MKLQKQIEIVEGLVKDLEDMHKGYGSIGVQMGKRLLNYLKAEYYNEAVSKDYTKEQEDKRPKDYKQEPFSINGWYNTNTNLWTNTEPCEDQEQEDKKPKGILSMTADQRREANKKLYDELTGPSITNVIYVSAM